jgi:uncharacterized protein YneF (UPF0154 family)
MKNMTIIFSIIIIILIIILGVFVFFSQTEKEVDKTPLLENELTLVKSQLSEANFKVIELQENEKYVTEQLRKARLDLNVLREVYSDLFTDASTCYYANYCLYYEDSCLNVLGDLFEGYSARDIHLTESDWCDGMYRDWEKYQSYDESLKK